MVNQSFVEEQMNLQSSLAGTVSQLRSIFSQGKSKVVIPVEKIKHDAILTNEQKVKERESREYLSKITASQSVYDELHKRTREQREKELQARKEAMEINNMTRSSLVSYDDTILNVAPSTAYASTRYHTPKSSTDSQTGQFLSMNVTRNTRDKITAVDHKESLKHRSSPPSFRDEVLARERADMEQERKAAAEARRNMATIASTQNLWDLLAAERLKSSQAVRSAEDSARKRMQTFSPVLSMQDEVRARGRFLAEKERKAREAAKLMMCRPQSSNIPSLSDVAARLSKNIDETQKNAERVAKERMKSFSCVIHDQQAALSATHRIPHDKRNPRVDVACSRFSNNSTKSIWDDVVDNTNKVRNLQRQAEKEARDLCHKGSLAETLIQLHLEKTKKSMEEARGQEKLTKEEQRQVTSSVGSLDAHHMSVKRRSEKLRQIETLAKQNLAVSSTRSFWDLTLEQMKEKNKQRERAEFDARASIMSITPSVSILDIHLSKEKEASAAERSSMSNSKNLMIKHKFNGNAYMKKLDFGCTSDLDSEPDHEEVLYRDFSKSDTCEK